MTTNEDLIGSYELLTHGSFNEEGVFVSTSEYLNGHLIYGKGNELAVLIHFSEFPQGPRDLLAYTGTFKINSSSELLHQIKLCSQAKRNNSIEIRSYRISKNILTLEAVLPNGFKFQSTWKKLYI